MNERRLRATLAAEVSMPDPADVTWSQAVRDAVREVLPEGWHVLPDGRSAASVVAKRAGELRQEQRP